MLRGSSAIEEAVAHASIALPVLREGVSVLSLVVWALNGALRAGGDLGYRAGRGWGRYGRDWY